MYCKISKVKVSGDKVDTMIKWVRDVWGPLISKQEGLRRYYFLVREDGEVIFFMIWSDISSIDSWSGNPEHMEILPAFKDMIIGPVDMKVYEICGHSVNCEL